MEFISLESRQNVECKFSQHPWKVNMKWDLNFDSDLNTNKSFLQHYFLLNIILKICNKVGSLKSPKLKKDFDQVWSENDEESSHSKFEKRKFNK